MKQTTNNATNTNTLSALNMNMPHTQQEEQEEEEEEEEDDDSSSFFDALLCEEEKNILDDDDDNHQSSLLMDNREHDHILSLLSKETHTHTIHAFLEAPRNDAVSWISKVSSFYGFTPLTTVLAVNYFDRFVTSLTFQRDKPWMTQLTALACLSLAAKMEEIHVPLLLDLQVEEPKFLFEAKTVQRMELLVLSTLQWRMNPVTPISFFEHIVRRIGLHWEFLWRCQRVLLSVIPNSRFMGYLPSTLAAATMIHVIKEIEPINAMEYINQLMGLLKTSEEQVNECYKHIVKQLVLNHEGIYNVCQKRKRISEPSSPGGVIDASFSCDSSNDSWTAASLISPSLSMEPMFKRSRAPDQQMRFATVNRVSINVIDSPP
ncbi:cyclin-D3-2-like [Arachis stenosperma]|uniref:cyclin-D3-2-like n=1 Tax=Arachis stenosperma TaxID=217475 RepID=UPI0025ABADBA|nr:cyclin-D3-2-like [Arachis stenosperma]XP_057762275.1 cyclin-D3-2-like [Arachis stenosperma]